MNLRAWALAAAMTLPIGAAAYDADALVSAAPGELPLILTAPHDGTETVGFVAARTSGATVRDLGTGELAQGTADLIQKKTGKRPYVVIAKFSRKYVDANRPPEEAIESEAALPAYRAYHDRVTGYIEDIRKRFPAGALLVDVHGQAQEPNAVFRGTRNGMTAKALMARSGPEALLGPKSLIGELAARGYRVSPAPDGSTLEEDRRFSGGFTVFRHGSQRPDGIDAIQLEFGSALRAQRKLADDFADALIAFMRTQHLLEDPGPR
jgi:N-formylglutamate amidohydrolase